MTLRIRLWPWLCALSLLPAAAAAETFVIDPETGSADGDGSADSPWRTLQEVVDSGLIETRSWESLPYEDGAQLVPVNAGAPVGAGDILQLRDGYHGDVVIESAYNDEIITIEAAPGHEPRVRRLLLSAVSGWEVRGLSISPSHATAFETTTLVTVESHNFRGPSYDVVIAENELFSVDDVSAWSQDDWNQLACNGVSVGGDDVQIRDNLLRNVNFGISVGGERALVEGNIVENFSGDGLRGLGDDGVFQYNVVRNCYAVNDNHDDGFQSWSVGDDGVGSGEVRGIVLRGNTIINYTDPDQPFRGTLQGIGCFDGFFVDWIVENNVVITDHWHGITLLGARNSRIVNNTVLDPNQERPGPPWVSVGDHKDGRPSQDCVVRNNLTTDVSVDTGDNVVVDTNLELDAERLDTLFVDRLGLDVRLNAGTAPIDAGSADLAPAIDRDGVARPQGDAIDIGAYEWFDGQPAVPDPLPDVGGPNPSGPDGSDRGTDGSGQAPESSAGADESCSCSRVGTGPSSTVWIVMTALALRLRRKAPCCYDSRTSRR